MHWELDCSPTSRVRVHVHWQRVVFDVQEVHQSNQGWSPVYLEDNLAVMSIGAHWKGGRVWPGSVCMLRSLSHHGPVILTCCHFAGFMLPDPDEAVIWRGPR